MRTTANSFFHIFSGTLWGSIIMINKFIANASRELITGLSILIGIAILAIFTVSGKNHVASSQLVGTWSGKKGNYFVSLEIERDNQCSLQVADQNSLGKFYLGSCVVDNSKTPMALSIRKMPGYDYDLYSIIEFVGENSFLLAPFATIKRARPMTYKDAVLMQKMN